MISSIPATTKIMSEEGRPICFSLQPYSIIYILRDWGNCSTFLIECLLQIPSRNLFHNETLPSCWMSYYIWSSGQLFIIFFFWRSGWYHWYIEDNSLWKEAMSDNASILNLIIHVDSPLWCLLSIHKWFERIPKFDDLMAITFHTVYILNKILTDFTSTYLSTRKW